MKQDKAQKYYLNDKIRIADIVNGYFFQGEQIISPEDIQEGDTQVIYMSEQKGEKPDGKLEIVLRNHDLLYKIVRGVNCFVLGLEQQNYTDPSMVLRVLEYTVGQYMKQRHRVGKLHDEKKDLRNDEFISRFSVNDLLKPVLVIVIYYGDVKWQGARSLHEVLDWTDIPVKWKNMFADFKMHLIEVQEIKDLDVFRSDLRILFGFLQNKNDQKKLKKFIWENREELSDLSPDIFQAMSALSNIGQIEQIKKAEKSIMNDRGGMDMCKAIDDMISDGENKGEKRGIDRVNKLNSFLIGEGRFEDLKRATEDKEYQNQLFAAYAI